MTTTTITTATSLRALCDALNAARDAGTDLDRQLSDLPTYGGSEPADTQGIYSWDADSLLVQGEDGFEVVARADTTPVEMYRQLRADGLSQSDACRALMRTGVSFDDAVALNWIVETGAPAPKWLHEDGTPTQAAIDWDRAAARASRGE